MNKKRIIWFAASTLTLILLVTGIYLLSDNKYPTLATSYSQIKSTVTSANRCPGGLRNAYGSFAVKEDTYSVYVKLNTKLNRETAATLYAIGDKDSSCHEVGRASLSSDLWTRMGSYNADHGLSGNFSLATNASGNDNSPSLTQPSILLVSDSDPACQPTTACQTNLDSGAKGTINPIAINGKDEPLFVYLAINPKKDKLIKVNYYVDSKSAYSTRQAESFSKY